jgi:CP family cyanate transporter-like MFS transporter
MAAAASRPRAAGRPAARSVLPLLAVLLVAANLRAPISAVGPVLPEIGRDTALAHWQLGLLSSLPVAAFAVCSPFGHRLAQRFGTDRTLVGALLVLGLGTVLRSTLRRHGLTRCCWVGPSCSAPPSPWATCSCRWWCDATSLGACRR